MSPDEQQVRLAHQAFYDAFAERDMEAMEEVWAETAPVTCIHPGWSLVSGRPAVLASWKAILEGPAPPNVVPSREAVQLFGDVAVVLCVETLGDGQLMVTNILARELGRWRMVHHHAGPISSAFPFDDEDDDEPPPGLLN